MSYFCKHEMLLGRFRHISIWVKLQNKNYLVSQLTELQNLTCISFVCVKKVKNVFSFLSRMSNFMNLKERRLLNNNARKTMFSFSKCFENMVFPKKSHWSMIFLVLSGKMIFLFPENMILFLDTKRKMIFLKKIPRNMILSSGVLERWSFQGIRA